jgi:predicted glycoside hydrolase/deacetylase ChbG (UPF0249 family)
MATRLIVNADDFGLTPGVNRAIAELHEAGALNSATLMANGRAFDDAVALAHKHPGLGVGCHIVLTDGVPVSPPDTVPSLRARTLNLFSADTFRPALVEFFLAVLLGQVDEQDIEREAVAQIQKLQHAGLVVTHLDTHKHTHILPAVARPLLRAAERCGVPAVRNPFEQPWSLALGKSALLRRVQVRAIQMLQPRFLALPPIADGRIRTTDGTIGISATGDLNEATLRAVVDAMPEGTWEIVCHPGYNDAALDAVTTRLRQSRDVEREALLTVFAQPHNFSAQRNGFTLISYKDL